MNMQRPPPFVLTEPVWTTGVAPPGFTPAPQTPTNTYNSGAFGFPPGAGRVVRKITHTIATAEQEYQAQLTQLPQIIENELTATRLNGPTNPVPPIEGIARELEVINRLAARKRAEFDNKTAIANSYYGYDPIGRPFPEILKKGVTLEKPFHANSLGMLAWNKSYNAAYDARLLSQTIHSLEQRYGNLVTTLTALQAAEQARLAAEQEAQRVAAERARIAAEQQRLKEIADAARLEAQLKALADFQAQNQAQEKARIARLKRELAEAEANAEAAAQHFAAEQARLQAEMEQRIEQIQKQLQTERQSRETRRKVIDTATAVAQRQAQLANLKIRQQKEKQAQERERQQALLAAEAETQRQAEQARLLTQWREETEARWQSPSFANVGSMAAFGPTFTGILGTFGVSPATSLALRTALRAAVAAAIAALASVAAPVLVGFAALLAPSRLGNGDLFSVSVPLSELAPDSTADLYELAAVGGEIDLPVRLGSRTIGNRVEIVVVTTDGVTVPASVPVKLAHFDARKNVYVSGSTVSNGPVITWTPLVEPQDPSTEFPLIDTDLPIYEGATVTPDTGRIDPFPELDLYGFGGFITVFPIESGIPPTFTMFRDRRQDPGVASGAGQPVSGNWLGAASTGEGAPIPMQIADKFRGREFSSFKAFRRVFWKAVANDEFLIDQFTEVNKLDIRNGLSPAALFSDQVGARKKFEIHHVKPINEGGSVYDIDNLRVLTPKQHIEAHSKKGEM
ncbi:S-type pyocin domain-containing protein [Pseudomonas sp. PMCC200344]|uniref:S-type pyocin domain-containing protein n=1 Tax=Pseudomonas sp. PMCC200344 TaxID=3042028 RepID=UPI0024B32B5F|nr:S-type pyocin domain-containing protein [Pseudomonas sp. PMCC200344]